MTLTVADVTSHLEKLYPPHLAEDWDSIGLIVGQPTAVVQRVHLAVDVTQAVVDEALAGGAQLLLTHHPLYLRGTDTVACTTPKGRMVHALISAGCALYNAHTNADSAPEGVAVALAELLELRATVPLQPAAADPALGIGRVGHLPTPQTLDELAAVVARVLPATVPGILVGGDLIDTVDKVAVSGGSGDSLLGAARAAGADVFITADLRHHPAQDHLAGGKPWLINTTHWASEWPWLPLLARALRAEFGPQLEVTISTLPTDPWQASY
ncbi:Nif3-like dinuclear metal center hexameric protein [Buchananella hordeovulneris]|uniref:Nif3-like dinuclear metal center hexameric protein n=1 Tax=Buchananella hordeovulneris TaxID=52770 RepID=UPI000F5DA60D|nr:Nif3-like dinuclear metal center hexameric protein [Buchananella hordeovulneris]RRD51743.1 Nif3-like dinuclear metal center hexameric protein [Buchananella hordeovulneris]